MPGASVALARDLAEPVPLPGRWADLRIRVLSAVVLVPLALGCVWIGALPYVLLIGAATAGLGTEWIRLRSGETRNTSRLVTVAGFLYVAIASASLLWLRTDPLVGRANVLIVLLLVWASDVGAYATGRAIGGPRLAPQISPSKTVAGAVGGLIAAVVVGLGTAQVLSPPLHLPRAALLAAALGVVAQAGDLFESWVKRRLGVKDSGTLIPGHGGLFDRLDALLAAAPAAALLALLARHGVAWWQ